MEGISRIIIVTDSIQCAQKLLDTSNQCAQKLLDTSNHPRQGHTIAISKSLRAFFNRDPTNSIQFWDCPSDDRWPLHRQADRQAKSHRIPIQYPNRESWELCRRNECEDIIKEWQMFFENAPYRENQFLDTYDDDDNLVTPTYAKGGSWLTTIGISNSICTRATRLITNHAPIGEYRARFFPNKNTSCPCSSTQLETRHHILRQCPLYKSYNRVGYVLSKIVDFLQSNL